MEAKGGRDDLVGTGGWQGTIEESEVIYREQSKVCMKGWNINDINRESQCIKGERNEMVKQNTGLMSRCYLCKM